MPIYSIADNAAEELKTIEKATSSLNKETEALERRYQSLQKALTELTKQQRKWENALTDSEKKSKRARDAYGAFLETAGGEENEEALKRQEEFRKALEETKNMAKEAEKAVDELGESGGKSIAATGGAFGELSGKDKEWPLIKKLGDTGVFTKGAEAFGDYLQANVSSAFGEETGNVISGFFGGAASGIAMGTAAGPWGMVIGGFVGAASGLLSAETKNLEAQDAAFKEYYGGLHDSVRQSAQTSIQLGSVLAMNKESEAAAARAEELRQSGASEEAIQAALEGTFQSISDQLERTKSGLSASYGEGFNKVREEGMREEQAAYEGPLGEAIGQLNEIAGSNQAYLDNLSEQYTREALSAVLLGEDTSLYDAETAGTLKSMGEEYAALSQSYDPEGENAQETALKMESLREQAEAMATAAYESSEQYQLAVETEQDQIAAIRENTAALDGWKNSYDLKQERTIGQAGTGGGLWEKLSGLFSGDEEYDGTNAFGLKRVPFDGYRAVLHEGERVLTAAEAREGGDGIHLNVQFGDVTVRGERDMDEIARHIVSELERARMRAG